MKKMLFIIPLLMLSGCGDFVLSPLDKAQKAYNYCAVRATTYTPSPTGSMWVIDESKLTVCQQVFTEQVKLLSEVLCVQMDKSSGREYERD